MGPLQTIPRGGRQWGKHSARRPNRYIRRGTLQWFGAFCPATGYSVGRGAQHRDAESCRRFWEEVMLQHWGQGFVYLIMDNLSTHKKALRELPPDLSERIKPCWLPTNSSWLNLIESYFATLQRTALCNTDHQTVSEIETSLSSGVTYLNSNPRPYVWRRV